jgi:competence protein ComEA
MIKKWHYFFQSYFGFSNKESRGFVLVLPVLLILFLIPKSLNFFQQKKHEKVYQEYLIQVDSLIQAGWEPMKVHAVGYKTHQDTTQRGASPKPRNVVALRKISFSEADSIELQIVPGIGQTLAGRVVKFRESLGGLYAKDQLLDVYGMKEETVEKIFEYFEFRPGIHSKLAINELDVNSLAKHPYINYGAAKVIVAYRDQHGPYRSAEELLKIKIFTQEWLDRLKPYLDLGGSN